MTTAINARIAEIRARIARIEEANISPAQRRWALADAWAEAEALEEELDALARAQEDV